MIVDELKKMENAILEGQEVGKLDQMLSQEALDTLGLNDVVEVGYYLNHLLWHAFEHNKSYTHLTERVDSCCEYIVNRFTPGDFDSVDLIEFWITMATMTFELTYQYEKVQSIMQWVLSTASKTKKQSIIALEYLQASQVVSSADRKIYAKMLSDIQTSEDRVAEGIITDGKRSGLDLDKDNVVKYVRELDWSYPIETQN